MFYTPVCFLDDHFVKRFAHCYWPNGLIDRDKTWHGARPRPWPHC